MITNEEINKIAKLAKFNLSQEELDIYAVQLTNIIKMIDIFKEVDCANIQPLISVCDMQQNIREDVVTCEDISEQLFANLHGEKGQLVRDIKCYVVPKVVE